MKKSVILFFILLLAGYAVYMDNRNPAKLPDGVLSIKYDMTQSYLIPTPKGYLVIDTGYEKNYAQFIKKIRQYGIKIADLAYIFLTHHHDDHSGFLDQLTIEYPDIIVILHEKSIPLLKQGKNNTQNGGGIVNNLINLLFKIKQAITPEWNFTFPPYTARAKDIILNGDTYNLKELLNINAFMLYTPGHTIDSISLVYNEDYIFCGDMSSNMLNFAGAKYLTIFNENIQEVYKSWDMIINSDIKYIIPIHGKPFEVVNLEKNINKYSSYVPIAD